VDAVSEMLIAQVMYVASDKLTLRGPSPSLVTSAKAMVSIVTGSGLRN
jgi:hypothetical protein